jgi:ribosomal protein L11 methyltransferase
MPELTSLPEKLFIYECRGPKAPDEGPSYEGFLGLWPEPPFYYLFFDSPSADSVNEWIKRQEGWHLNNSYVLDYDQWQQVSSREQQVGPFTIQMNETPGEGAGEGLRIRLNPGVVFGSGLHDTTKGCLLATAYLFERFPSIERAVDLGTGTGILAIACAKLGVPRVIAIDCNPLAALVAGENMGLNQIGDVVSLLVARELSVLREPSDLLLMNLEWPSLHETLQSTDWLKFRHVVMSGFLKSKWTEVKALIPSGFEVIFQEVLEDWLTVAVSRAG